MTPSHYLNKCWLIISFTGPPILFTGLPTFSSVLDRRPVSFAESDMGSANERQRPNVTSSFIGWAHTQNDPRKDRCIFLLLEVIQTQGSFCVCAKPMRDDVWRQNVTSSHTGWAHTQNDPCKQTWTWVNQLIFHLPKFQDYTFVNFLYRIDENLVKSTCSTASFTCHGC